MEFWIPLQRRCIPELLDEMENQMKRDKNRPNGRFEDVQQIMDLEDYDPNGDHNQ